VTLPTLNSVDLFLTSQSSNKRHHWNTYVLLLREWPAIAGVWVEEVAEGIEVVGVDAEVFEVVGGHG